MRKLIAAIVAALAVCLGCFVAACGAGEPEPTPTPEPLTITDCFKDFVPTIFFKSSYNQQGYTEVPYSGENVSLSELVKSENNIEAARYGSFLLFTTDKAALIEVVTLSFDVVVSEDSLIQFCLQMNIGDTLYSNSVTATAGTPATITFTNVGKHWSVEEAGASEMVVGRLVGEASTYLRVDLVNKGDLTENSYSIQNLKMEFVDFKG